MQAHLQNI